ncbi:hypothetical protein LCGC14_1299830 [marine sediment metagenome]|uniref:Uncharacterized protein n=1 Tax=marine sediment metagenome TaxID=412755 RepID=A0A0F9NSW8_9ZZZZ
MPSACGVIVAFASGHVPFRSDSWTTRKDDCCVRLTDSSCVFFRPKKGLPEIGKPFKPLPKSGIRMLPR